MTYRSTLADLLPPVVVRQLRSIRPRRIAHPLGIEFGARNANAKAYVEHRLYDRFLPVLCRHLPMGWLVDVGANVGATAVGIARECANPILCVEMDDEFCALLRRNTARLNVRAVQALVGTGHYAEIATSLDSVVADIPANEIVLIKTDTDGYDADVLLSAEHTIGAVKPILFWQNEFHNARQQGDLSALYEKLSAVGYRYVWIFDNFGNLMLTECDYKALRELNRYVASQDQHGCTRTIYYTDVLAATDQHLQYVRKAICDYQRVIQTPYLNTGLYAASQRAAHQILDNPNKIFEDPLALRIISAEAELQRSPAQFQNRVERTMRALMVVRNRYAEDELARSIQRGIRQYIILGAGLDTFAYRNCFPRLQVFEVDHPATQAWKRSCLERAAIPIPASVTFVSVDFERQMMIDALGQSGFKSNELTFISWLGVVRYLSSEAFISVLTSIVSSMRPGSEVVFDCGRAPSLLQRLREGSWMFKKNAFRPTYYDPASLKSDLKRIGFADVQFFGPTELNDRYCNGRTDGLRVPMHFYLVKARV